MNGEKRGKSSRRLLFHAFGRTLRFAGLWEFWQPKDQPGEALSTCTITHHCHEQTVAPIRTDACYPAQGYHVGLAPGDKPDRAGFSCCIRPRQLADARMSRAVNDARQDNSNAPFFCPAAGNNPSARTRGRKSAAPKRTVIYIGRPVRNLFWRAPDGFESSKIEFSSDFKEGRFA